MDKDIKESILILEKYQRNCNQLLSIFAGHSKSNPKKMEVIEVAITFLIERFSSIVHSLPPLIEAYYSRSATTVYSIYSIIRSFCLDAIQICEYIDVIENNQSKNEDDIKYELNGIASRHFCDRISEYVNNFDQDSEDFKTILNNYDFCFKKDKDGKFQKDKDGKFQKAYKNRSQPTRQVKIHTKELQNYFQNVSDLYDVLCKVEHFQIIGFGIIRSPELFISRFPIIVANEMKQHIGYLCFFHQSAFERYDISTPILNELGMK
jgi:hypothetical protein